MKPQDWSSRDTLIPSHSEARVVEQLRDICRREAALSRAAASLRTQAGERGGVLGEVLQELADTLEQYRA